MHPSSGKYFDNSIAAAAHHPSPVVAPHHGADAFAAHDAMAADLLRACAFLEGPDPEAGVVAGRDEFAAVRGEGECGDGGWVSKHGVGALTWKVRN